MGLVFSFPPPPDVQDPKLRAHLIELNREINRMSNLLSKHTHKGLLNDFDTVYPGFINIPTIARYSLLGRTTVGTGIVEEIISTGDTTQFLRGDLTWKKHVPIITVQGFTQADITAALALIPSTGAAVFFPAGTYDITATITIPYSNVTLFGEGRSTKLYNAVWASWGTPGHTISIASKDNCIVRDLMIDGRAANTGQAFDLIHLQTCNDCQILNNYITYSDQFGIYTGQCNDTLIQGNLVENSDASGIYIYGYSGAGYNISCCNNATRSNGGYGSAGILLSYTHGAVVTGNTSYLDASGIYSNLNYDADITGNTISSCVYFGSYLNGGAVVLNNNEFISCGNLSVYVDNITGSSICGNVIKNGLNSGLYIDNASTNGLEISGNSFITNGNTFDDIRILNGSNYLIANNLFIGASGKAERAINITGGSNVTISGNVSYLHDTAGIGISAGVTGVIIRGNRIGDSTPIVDAGTGTVIDNYDGTNFSFNKAPAITPFTTAGVLHNAATTGVLSSSLIVDADVSASAAIATTKLGAGAIVQVVNTMTGEVATGTTQIPLDDTIPQITEGDEYITLSITPKSTSNKLKVDVVWVGSHSTAIDIAVVLFNTDVHATNAIGLGEVFQGTGTGRVTITFTCYVTAPTTSLTTFRVRAGGTGAGTLTFNGANGNRYMGGKFASSITITEICA